MRILSYMLFTCALLLAALALLFYLIGEGGRCAFALSGNCSWHWPWEGNLGEAILFFFMPMLFAIGLTVGGIKARRIARGNRHA